jgi:hypothetical protein
MKICLILLETFLLSSLCLAQQAQVVIFKHELRWTDETKFPNYFLMPGVRDSIFNNTKQELTDYLKVTEIKFPAEVEYKIMNGFGKQKTDMPPATNGDNYQVGIFSFITRATSGWAIFWNLKMVIRQGNKTILDSEVSHELEYFNSSGYLTSKLWMTPEDFRETFIRLVKETLGALPASNDKIIIGSLEAEEEKAQALMPASARNLLKLHGAWKDAGNFSAILLTDKDTLLDFHYKDGFESEYHQPSFSGVLASLFTATTGIDMLYDQKVINEKNGALFFPGDQKIVFKMKWISVQTRSVQGVEYTTQISDPVVTEVYDNKVQTGYFLYTNQERVWATDKTKEKLDFYAGYQKSNTLGIEKIHRIEGNLSGLPIVAEMNESEGIITVLAGNEVIGVMVVENCNPDNSRISSGSISKNKHFMTSGSTGIGKPSMNNEEHNEWYPLYLPENVSQESVKLSIQILVCLFFGMGN